MQISSIVDIVEGELLNTPSISFIYNIKTNITKVHEGDLFITNNQDEIPEAIGKGAFGVIFDSDIPITDKEIAWIKVHDINDALSKLLRFKLSTYELNAYYCNDFTFELLNLFVKNNDNSIKLISDNLKDEINSLDDLEYCKTIICSDQNILNKIYPNNSNFNNEKFVVQNLIEHSLFETSFSYKEHYFSRLRLSSLYINDFLKVYTFFKNGLDSLKLKKSTTFKPLFIDKYFKNIEHGYSDKFIIAQMYDNLAAAEIKYIQNKYKYAKTFIFSKNELYVSPITPVHIIKNLDEIKKALTGKKFNAVYILGFTRDEIDSFIKKSSTKSLL